MYLLLASTILLDCEFCNDLHLLQTVVLKFVLKGAPKGDNGSEDINRSREIHANPAASGRDISEIHYDAYFAECLVDCMVLC